MASVLVPKLREHGVAATFIAGRYSHLPAPALCVFVPEASAYREEAVSEVAEKLGIAQLRRLGVETRKAKGTLLLYAPHDKLDTRAFWKAVGLDPKGLQKVVVTEKALIEQRLSLSRALGMHKAFFDPVPIGTSRYGARVTETPLGRVAYHPKNNKTYREWEITPDGRRQGDVRDFFFRATTVEELSGCARGAARMMSVGNIRFNRASFTKLYEQVVPAELRETAGLSYNDWHEHVEAHCALTVQQSLEAGNNPRLVAGGLNARLPNREGRGLETLRFDQFSTPLTVAAAAATVLSTMPGETALEPMVGNGVLASALAAHGAKITGAEIDPARAARARTALGNRAEVISTSFEDFAAGVGKDQQFDMLIMNPPFGTDYKQRMATDLHGRRVRLSRPDHHYVFEALKHLKADGRAFIVIAGDFVNEGKLEGSRREFDTWLRSVYDIAGAAVLDGNLYRKMGTTFPVQLYAVGPQRAVPLSAEEAVEASPAEIPVLRTTDELDAWADIAGANLRALVGARRPDYTPGPQANSDPRRAMGVDGGSTAPSWADAVEVNNAAEAFGAFVALRVVALADGSRARLDQTRRGWTVLRRDDTSFVARHADPGPSNNGWSRDQALQAALQMWSGERDKATAIAATAETAAPRPAAPKPAVVPPAAGDQGGADEGSDENAPPPRRPAAPRAPALRGSRNGRAAPVPAEPEEKAAPAEPEAPAPLAGFAPVEPASDGMVGAMPAPLPVAEFVDDDDPFLLPYEPMSKLGEASTRIQRSLSSPIMAALADVRRRFGDIDEMVSNRLGMSLEQMEQRFSPEQIDAFALSFAASERGAGFLNSDNMGVGKGRFLAGHAALGLIQERPVVFFTERPDLFQDLIGRDLCDVTGLKAAELPKHIRPFIMNNCKESRVLDYETRDKNGAPSALFRYDAATARKAQETRAIPATCNVLLGTYSQLSHLGGVWKAEAVIRWMEQFDRPPILLIDEAHRAAGDVSKCGQRMVEIVEAALRLGATPIYSSATPLKSLRNIKLYAPILPNVGMSTDQLLELVESSPLAIQEALAYEMARTGTMVSREMDQAGVVREFVNLVDLNPEKYEHLREKMDIVSAFLGEMMEKSGEVKGKASAIEKLLKQEEERANGGQKPETSQVQVTSMSPATRFHTISQYMMFAFQAQFAEELTLGSIASGQKPILVVENVGDSMVEFMLAGDEGDADEDDEAPEKAEIEAGKVGRLPDLGDLLTRTAASMLWISQRNGFGEVQKIRVKELEPWFEEFRERVRNSGLGDLTTSGIDLIRERLSRYELSVGELTRRRYEVSATADGYEVSPRNKPPMQEIVRAFNNGDVDVLVMNRSASSGISMQASPRNGPDLRQRNMIKLQLQGDITHERQIDGRIHRTGQVQPGRYTIPMPGFAASDRLAAMYNRKNRSLSSASRATRENATNIDNAPDLLNAIGDKVVHNFLSNAPVLAERFGIDIRETEPEGIARKFMGRLIILPSAQQTQILAEVESSFRLLVADLEANGENPLRLSRYEWGAQVKENRMLIAGDMSAEQTFRKPLTLNEISYTEKVRPVRWDRVEEAVAATREKWTDDGHYIGLAERFSELDDLVQNGVDFRAGLFDRVLNRDAGMGSLGLEIIPSSVAHDVLRRRESITRPNSMEKGIFDAVDRAHFLARIVPNLEPGSLVGIHPDVVSTVRDTSFYSSWGETHEADAALVPAIIRSVRFAEERPLNLGGWEVDFAVPGEQSTLTISLAAMFGGERFAEEEAAKRAKQAAEDGEPVENKLPQRAIRNGLEVLAALREGLDEDHGRQLGNLLDMALKDPTKLHEITRSAAKTFFDRALPGEITRKRYTLEGNIFAAVAMSVQQRLGEKIIYTAEDGELRHAVLLKNNKLAKLTKQLEQAIAERTVLAPDDPTVLSGVVDLFNATVDYAEAIANASRQGEQATKQEERYGAAYSQTFRAAQARYLESAAAPRREMIQALGRIAFYEEPERERSRLTAALQRLAAGPAFETWAKRLAAGVVRAANVPAAISLGPNPFDGPGEPVVKVTEGSHGGIEVGAFDGKRLSRLAKGVAADRQGAVVIPSNSGAPIIFTHGKGDLPASGSEINWRVTFGSVRIPAGVVPGQIKDEQGWEQIVAHADKHAKDFTLHGPMRALFEEAQAVASEVKKDVALQLENGLSDSSAPVNHSPAMAGA
ncbi:strawberry notch family protein [Xanthobacter sp. DSM 14520]|uniref:strawberry notch-like NTP hydrolase domain-containing protein n=1 Tax=Xanthobacter autotrophicus (strain ATCC BAA-1158 / Py2) TaxID=78245 RepID=UPI0037267C83